ncbi:MAG: SDR family NAD(P)-dependent oxidoreductase, partial [Pseudomonadota bacterium]
MTKTILITGATDGIGLLTAKTLAEQGHRVLLHGRSSGKLAAAAEDVGGDPITFQADLSDLDATGRFAQAVLDRGETIDVLINNAGIFKMDQPVLPNGQDARFVVNTLAPYALTVALLPLMHADGRVINLSSAAQAPVDLAALKGARRLGAMDAYAQSKRAIALWSAALAQAHRQGPVFIAVNPGSLLASKMVKEGFGVAGNDLGIGADILCRLATSPDFATASGRY